MLISNESTFVQIKQTQFLFFSMHFIQFYSAQFKIRQKKVNCLGFRRIQYHKLERMFGRLFLSPFGHRGFRNNGGYYNSDINGRISRLQFVYNFVEGFPRVKSGLWCSSRFLVGRHIMKNVNLFSMSIQFFQFLGREGTLLANKLFCVHLCRLSND